MKNDSVSKKLALIGGGPAALYLFKNLVDGGNNNYHIHIYERQSKLGAGMPYSKVGASYEHVTNISDTEIPELEMSVEEWLKIAPSHLLHEYQITPENFNELKVMPRLLFGEYLCAQFEMLCKRAASLGFTFSIDFNTAVKDIIDDKKSGKVIVVTENKKTEFDSVVICTGHYWPKKNEGRVKGYFDSPYPPQKLMEQINYPVALRGSSLTAFDALRTLSRCNGHFEKNERDGLTYILKEGSEGFKMVMHSLDGMLPAIRIHMDEPALTKDAAMTPEELESHRAANNGFVSLDYLFEEKFKKPFKEKDPVFFKKIKDMTMEEFVENMMSFRERIDPFTLFRAEYREAEKSIRQMRTVPWKELLSDLNYAVNYPAKYFSAEDMLRLRKVLMPLISIVIAFVPQSSARELIALHEAGVLSIVAVDRDSKVEPGETEGIVYHYKNEEGKSESVPYKMFIDCIGQPMLSIEDIPFRSLVDDHTVAVAKLPFRSADAAEKSLEEGAKEIHKDLQGNYYLHLPGIMINDNFQVVDDYGAFNDRIYVMAVPLIGGVNPDYSGLDFCATASTKIAKSLSPDVKQIVS
jgi:hypothetical protein